MRTAGLQKVLIHDAARPFVSADLISHVIAELERSESVIPGLPIADTMKFAPGGLVERTVDRQSLWSVQTPQGFDLGAILAAHAKAYEQNLQGLTDDAAVAEKFGIKVRVIAGRAENQKLTTAEDIHEADRILMAKANSERLDVRVGQGIDFHEFEAGDGVVLCGVKIPHDKKLKGHSDADAAMHALTDAILGALGEGDIGTFFPPSDAQWKGVSSSIFLRKAVDLLSTRNGIIANVDITILAEAPRVGPHIDAMKILLSPLLHLSRSHCHQGDDDGAIGRHWPAGRTRGICNCNGAFAMTLEERAAALLEQCRSQGVKIATAESCTGGMLAALLTSIAGSSDVFDCSFVTYSNEAKNRNAWRFA